jgi:hypothetical protein
VPTITHTYSPPAHPTLTRVTFTPVTLSDDGSESVGYVAADAVVSCAGEMSATFDTGTYVVEHQDFGPGAIPSGWSGLRYISVTADADLTDLVGYIGADDLRSGTATPVEVTAALALKAPLNSPTFTGTVGGVTAAMVGLDQVANLAPADLPLSDAATEALGLKLDAAGLDAGVAAKINDRTSDARVAGDATWTLGVDSPRDARRVTQERRPTLLVNRIFPTPAVPYTIVHASGDTLWGYGTDYGLRKSLDRGATWTLPVSGSTGSMRWAVNGLFVVTMAGSILTSSNPSDLSAPKIIRSADGGVTWADVVAAQTDVDYLGVTSICQDPITAYLYLVEYVTASAATKATWRVMRSTDDGVTWTVFATFQRDAAAYPTTAIRHGHGVQWDPVSERIYILTGDAEAAAGIYRVNAAGDALEKVVINSETTSGYRATAVGLMFFPDYIAWGMDASSDSYLLRLPRTKVGIATPADVEEIGRLQSNAWYTCRVATDGTEWLTFVSNQVGVGRVDAAAHVYRVADNGATLDEVMTIPTISDTSYSYGWPLGGPLQTNAEGLVWLAHNVTAPATAHGTLQRGQQFAAILGWGSSNALHAHVADRLPYGPPVTQSTGAVSLAALETRYFGVTEAPLGAPYLYILDVGREVFAGSGFFLVEAYDVTTADVLLEEDGTTGMQWYHRSRRAVHLTTVGAASAPYLYRSVYLSAGKQVRFRVKEGENATCDGCAYISYAWGY